MWVLFCSLAGGLPFISDGAGTAANSEGTSLKSLDIAKKHCTPLLLALAGAQVTAQAYMAVRSSLPKVPPSSNASQPSYTHLLYALKAISV